MSKTVPDQRPTKRKKGSERDSYLFYGRHPGDWFETKTYELLFATAPPEATRTKIAEVFERTRTAGVSADDAWQWTGPWVLFEVRNEFAVRSDEPAELDDRFFDEMGDLIAAIHRVAPLREAVFLGAREASGVAEQPIPSAGPKYRGLDFTGCPFEKGRVRDSKLGKPAVDRAFEARRRAIAGAIVKKRQAEAEAAAEKEAKTAARTKASKPNQPTLIPISSSDVLPATVLRLPKGIPKRGKDEGSREVAISPDQSVALIGQDQVVHRVELPSGKSTRLYNPQGSVFSILYLRDDLAAVLANRRLILIDPRDQTGRELAVIAKKDSLSCFAAREGRLVVVCGEASVTLVGVVGESLEVIGEINHAAREGWESAGRVFVTDKPRSFELVGFDEQLSALKNRSASPKREKPIDYPLALAPASEADVAWLTSERHDISEEQPSKLPDYCDWYATFPQSSLVVGGDRSDGDFAWYAADGKVRSFGENVSLLAVAPTPDGSSAIVLTKEDLFRIDLATGKRHPLPFPLASVDQEHATNLEFTADGRAVLRTLARIILLDSKWKVVAEDAGDFGQSMVIAHGRRVVATSWNGQLDIHAVRGDTLKRLRAFPLQFTDLTVSPDGERIFIKDFGDNWLEVTGLAASWKMA